MSIAARAWPVTSRACLSEQMKNGKPTANYRRSVMNSATDRILRFVRFLRILAC